MHNKNFFFNIKQLNTSKIININILHIQKQKIPSNKYASSKSETVKTHYKQHQILMFLLTNIKNFNL